MATTFDDLIAQLHDVATMLRELEQEPTKKGFQKLLLPAAELARITVLIRNRAKNATNKSKAQAALNAILKEVSLEGFDEGVGLESFFDDVSTSMVTAQRALDRRSAAYVRERDPNIAPAHFAIPNVKAKVKAGFTKTRSRGVNLILFSKQQSAQDYGESTVSFEIVSAPPGPDAMPYGKYLVPIPRFLVLEDERKRVLDWLGSTQGLDKKASYARMRESALVVRRDGVDDMNYLVFWPAQQEGRLTWDLLRIYHVRERDGGVLALAPRVWQEPWGTTTPPAQVEFVLVENDKASSDTLRRTGHAAMLLLEFLQQWQQSVTLPEQAGD